MSRRIDRFAWVASLSCLLGCNAILGIHAPSNRVLDASVPEVVENDPAGGFMESDFDDAGTAAPDITRWANWPMPNPSMTGLSNAQAYGAEKQGVVTDEVTHLEWQAQTDGDERTWRKAIDYCAKLSLDGGGFRLPSRVELLSLVDFTSEVPNIDTKAFPDTPAKYFWSSSRFITGQSIAWVVNFGPGPGFVSSSELSTTYPVRCVRVADATAPRGHFVVKDGTVEDVATKLTWQRVASDETYNWKEADASCNGLDLEGEGWRLPTTKELQTLVDETRSGPAIDLAAFPKATSDSCWTSSRVAGSKTDVWTVSFQYGFDAALRQSTEQHVRCVR